MASGEFNSPRGVAGHSPLHMYTMKAILSLLLVASALGNAFAEEPSKLARAAFEECSASSQAGMRECLLTKVNDSSTALKQAEDQARQTLRRWGEDSRYANLAQRS